MLSCGPRSQSGAPKGYHLHIDMEECRYWLRMSALTTEELDATTLLRRPLWRLITFIVAGGVDKEDLMAPFYMETEAEQALDAGSSADEADEDDGRERGEEGDGGATAAAYVNVGATCGASAEVERAAAALEALIDQLRPRCGWRPTGGAHT